MKLKVGTNLDPLFFKSLAALQPGAKHRVAEVFTSVPDDSGASTWRTDSTARKPDFAYLAKCVRLLARQGISFDYTLNRFCCGGQEYDAAFQKDYFAFLDRLRDIGVSSLTISNPYVVELTCRHRPGFDIWLSSYNNLAHASQVERFLRMGVRRFILSPDVNRDFRLLRGLKRRYDLELSLIANEPCIRHCPFYSYHAASTSHRHDIVSPEADLRAEQYPFLHCCRTRLEDPAEVVKAPWIRPVDMRYYEEAGVDSLKLATRSWPVDKTVYLLRAYLEEREIPDFYNLISHGYGNNFPRTPDGRPLPPLDVSIDALPKDFMAYFAKKGVSCATCEGCSYCGRMAAKYVKVDPRLRKLYLRNLKALLDRCTSRAPRRRP